MRTAKNKYWVFCMLIPVLMIEQSLSAQEEKDIGTQQVTVTKSYTPSLSESFKPNTEEFDIEALLPSQRSLEYRPQEIEVVSTFVPNKATPLKLKQIKKEPTTNSELSLGFGNLGQYLFDASLSTALDNQQVLGVDVFAEGEGSVPETLISSSRSQLDLATTHHYNTSQFSALHQLGFESTRSSYYGLYTDDSSIREASQNDQLDFNQQFYSVFAKSQWQWYNNWLKGIDAKFRFTGDQQSTKEQYAYIAPKFRISLFNAFLDISPSVHFLQTEFQRGYYLDVPYKYNQSKASVQIQLSDVRNKFKYKLGASAQYVIGDGETAGNDIFIYPQVFIAYSDPDKKMQPYLKLNGNLRLNSYFSAFHQNPFVAPSLELRPTNEKYTGELGFTTLFQSGIEFQLAGQYSQAENFNLFQRFAAGVRMDQEGYRLANSFGWVYDSVDRIGAFAGLKYKSKNQSEIQIRLQQNNYTLGTESVAWNLPDLEATLVSKINLGSKIKWYSTFEFLGSRTAAERPVFLQQDPAVNQAIPVTLSAVSFVKSEISYQVYDQWNLFARYRSVLGSQAYQWHSTPLNQNIILIGARYKLNVNL